MSVIIVVIGNRGKREDVKGDGSQSLSELLCCVCRKRELVRETERGRVRDRERERERGVNMQTELRYETAANAVSVSLM